MRKQELNEDVAAILQSRIALSQSGQFPMRKVWEGWGMSKSTLLRYKDGKYRELSREIARKHNSLRFGLGGKCPKCTQRLAGHRRCSECEILLHALAFKCRCGERHGDTKDGVTCTSCIDTRARDKLSPYQELYGQE